MVLKFLTLGLTALVPVPSAAHLFKMPRKHGLDRDAYFIVQGIYAVELGLAFRLSQRSARHTIGSGLG